MHMENEIWECPDKKEELPKGSIEDRVLELENEVKALKYSVKDIDSKFDCRLVCVWVLLIPLCFLAGFVLSRVL